MGGLVALLAVPCAGALGIGVLYLANPHVPDAWMRSVTLAHLLIAVACGCLCLVGVALVVFGELRRVRAASLGGLTVLAASFLVVAAISASLWADRTFDSQEFREAVARQDVDEVQEEAYQAVAYDTLIGLSVREARRLLGKPERTGPKRRLWIWSVGEINNTLGPGDAADFYVQFGRDGRVVRAEVEQSFE